MNELFTKEFNSDSDDEEYVPTTKELDDCNKDGKETKIKTKTEEEECKKKVNEMWEKMQNNNSKPPQPVSSPTEESKDEKSEEQKLEEQIKEALRKAKEQKKKIIKDTYYFAGQKFEGTKEINEKEAEKMKKKETHQSLDKLIDAITKKKNISTMEKSKKDWQNYVEEQKIEKELMINRKDGYLGKKHFLENSNALIHEQNRIMIKKAKFAYESKLSKK